MTIVSGVGETPLMMGAEMAMGGVKLVFVLLLLRVVVVVLTGGEDEI